MYVHVFVFAFFISLPSPLARACCLSGASACFFASHPSLHYVLTCAHPAERDLARHLCLKAVENQEIQNIHNLRIDGRSVKIREDKSLWQVGRGWWARGWWVGGSRLGNRTK